MIGSATRLDPLPTTFDHPSRILRSNILGVNRKLSKIPRFFTLLWFSRKVCVRLLSALAKQEQTCWPILAGLGKLYNRQPRGCDVY